MNFTDRSGQRDSAANATFLARIPQGLGPAEQLKMTDEQNSNRSRAIKSLMIKESSDRIDRASYVGVRQGTMIESAIMLDNRVIAYYFHQHFEVDIFPHGNREVLPSDSDYLEVCERFDLRHPGDKAVALWKLEDGHWVNRCSALLRLSVSGEKCEM